jgi:hypothetical protein
MQRYQPGDHVRFHLNRHELIRFQLRTGSRSLPAYQILRVFPATQDGIYAYEVQCSSEPYSRVAREHELAPIA